MTEIGEIPEEWDADKISTLKESMYYGVTAKATEKNTNMRFLRTTDIINFKFTPSELPFCKITEKRSALSKCYLKKNDIIVARAGTVGVSVLVKEDLKDTLFGSYLIKITLNQEKANMSFVHYYFQSQPYWNKLSSAQGGTIKNINLPFLGSLVIPVPPLPEQQKIAEILTTADRKIELVDHEIQVAEKLKKGLMQTLLTRGIGHTKFKLTEIGEIPEEWVIKSIDECNIPTRNMDPTLVFGKGEFEYIDVSGISPERLRIVETKRMRGIDAPSRARREVREDDILFATIRPYLKRIGKVPKNLDGNVCSTAFCVIRANQNLILSDFLYYSVASNNFVNKVSGLQTGSAYPAVSYNQVLSEKIALPALIEQKKISEILIRVDEKLELLRKKKIESETLKKGLMQILLTGLVRVKINSSRSEN